MSMANRNDSEERQHETLPGFGPGPSRSTPVGGPRPVEQIMDAAIERVARERGLARVDPAFPLARQSTPPPLRWKGFEVSEEFRRYAERVAHGEDLPPFEGRVLAEPSAEFPWDSTLRGKPASSGFGARLALGVCAAAILGVAGWSVALRLEAEARSAAALSASSFTAAAEAEAHAGAADRVGAGVEPEPAEPRALASGATGEAEAHFGLRHRDLQPSVGHETLSAALASTARGPLDSAGSSHDLGALALGGGPHATPPASAPASPGELPAPAELAPPGALKAALGAVLSTQPAPEPPRPEPKASPSAEAELDFGIDPAASPASRAATEVAPSVVDIMRSAPSAGESVRKKPAGESSAKGSLLVESPSF